MKKSYYVGAANSPVQVGGHPLPVGEPSGPETGRTQRHESAPKPKGHSGSRNDEMPSNRRSGGLQAQGGLGAFDGSGVTPGPYAHAEGLEAPDLEALIGLFQPPVHPFLTHEIEELEEEDDDADYRTSQMIAALFLQGDYGGVDRLLQANGWDEPDDARGDDNSNDFGELLDDFLHELHGNDLTNTPTSPSHPRTQVMAEDPQEPHPTPAPILHQDQTHMRTCTGPLRCRGSQPTSPREGSPLESLGSPPSVKTRVKVESMVPNNYDTS